MSDVRYIETLHSVPECGSEAVKCPQAPALSGTCPDDDRDAN